MNTNMPHTAIKLSNNTYLKEEFPPDSTNREIMYITYTIIL